MNQEKKIFVYADFAQHSNELVGVLYVSRLKGEEVYSFEYDENWLQQGNLNLDPNLELYKGRQYLNNKKIFGAFSDSSPDRWGRTLMDRREEVRARFAGEKPRKLYESDYLLGVYDEARMGGLRFKVYPSGEYVSKDIELATPPWTKLRELEQASRSFEKNDDKMGKWLKQLLAPGSSLGGARPKASVLAPDGSLWIAKFPSKHDDFDSGAWEMVVHDLAKLCGINVPEAKLEKFSKLGSTYLSKRFDRNQNKRIHMASALTLLGKNDGASSADGSSYLDIASFIKSNGSDPSSDLEEIFKRIVFSMAVSNTDDHLRNHAFILKDRGWKLAPAYDINPDIFGEYLSLNVDDTSAAIDYEVAINASEYYGLKANDSRKIVRKIDGIVQKNWQATAKQYGIPRSEIERMKPAFMI